MLLSSSNGFTWTPHQTQDLTFRLLGCRFSQTSKTVSLGQYTVTNLSDARSRIEDTDYSAETTALAKAQILSQASTAMLAQANLANSLVLRLLGGQ